MKQKELKNLAKKIAKYELIIQTTDDPSERSKAEAAIMELSGKVNSLEDIVIIDELVQEYIEELS